jgi:hypothetical protein
VIAPSMKPVFSRSWTDAFSTAFIHLEGSTGQQTVLLLCPLEHGQSVLNILENLEAFKGRITLAVLEQNHSTPIEAILRFLEPKIVISLDADSLVSSGDALNIEKQSFTSSSGLEYQHGGKFTAWHSSLSLGGSHGSSVIGAIAASSLSAVVACHPQQLQSVIQQIITT